MSWLWGNQTAGPGKVIISGDERPPSIKVSLYCKGDWYMSQVSEKAVSFEPEEKRKEKNGK